MDTRRRISGADSGRAARFPLGAPRGDAYRVKEAACVRDDRGRMRRAQGQVGGEMLTGKGVLGAPERLDEHSLYAQ